MSSSAERTRSNCSSLSFRSLLVAQFFGALNDNLFKLFVTLLVVRNVMAQNNGITHLVLINICFITPYILFSTIAGGLADKLSKSSILRAAKVFELFVMSAAAFFLAKESTYALLAVLFCMGLQSTLFSPSKYGLLPEILDEVSLSKGNGYLEFVTFIGIIFGTAMAGIILIFFDFASGVPGLLLIAMSCVGLLATTGISKVPAANPDSTVQYNPLTMGVTALRMRSDRGLFLSILAISYFWAIGALYQLNLVLFASIEAGLGDLAVSLQLASLGVGIGVGSIAAGKVSEGKVELGLVPIGALGLAFWSMILSCLPQYPVLAGMSLVGVGFCAGFYIVPLNAFLQENSPAQVRGNYLAACNFVSFSGMLLFSLLLLLGIDHLGLPPSGIFFFSGLSAVGIAIYICTVLPEVLLRCINWLLMHLLYRIKVVGEENIPSQGGALLVCNHVSMIDACLLLASVTRPVRFLMFKPYYENKFVNPFAKVMGSIPIEAGGKQTQNALSGASEAVASGDLVGIFAEGAITRSGQMLRFRSGLERIMKDVDAPIIPVHLDQVWGSVFSFRNGRFFWKIPRKIPYPVQVTFGKPLPANSSAAEVRAAVEALSTEAFSTRPSTRITLPEAFIKTAKNNGMRTAIYSNGRKLSYYELLAKSLLLAKRIRETIGCASTQNVGVFVAGAPSADTALLHLAASICGYCIIPVDESIPDSATARVKKQLGIKHCLSADSVTSAPEGCGFAVLADLEQSISAADKAKAWAQAVLLPCWLLRRSELVKSNPMTSAAEIVFTRGTTGEHKAVALSHHNIVSNCSAFQELFTFYNDDTICGDLPFSHSMGVCSLLWLPLLSGCRVRYCAETPAGTKSKDSISEKCSYLFLTTSQLEERLANEPDRDLESAQFVVVGGDVLRPVIKDAFTTAYSAQLLEGYGSAELSPLAIVAVPDDTLEKVSERGSKPGMIGRALPGVAIKVVQKGSMNPCPTGIEGELLVKGPNVMLGYVGSDDSQVLDSGWLRTGDRAIIDADGFVELRGRLN